MDNTSKLFICFVAAVTVSCSSPKKETAAVKPVSGWERLGPGGGGATFIPTFSFATAENFMLRCDMTGSYLTHDGGDSYDQINFANGASCYAFDPKNAAVIYVGADGLSRSTDNGATWERIFPKKEDVVAEEYKGDHAGYSISVNNKSLYDPAEPRVENIAVDPVNDKALYFTMGKSFFYSLDGGITYESHKLIDRAEFLYTNATSCAGEVLIFTGSAVFSFNKSSHQFSETRLPADMSPAFSFTGGIVRGSDKVWIYAIHHDVKQKIDAEFGYSEIWRSADKGLSWEKIPDEVLNNNASGIKPSYSMISCASLDADQVYVVTNRYEEKKGDKKLYWYGALKTSDGGNQWNWVWKGGGGSGQYGVKDGIAPANLKDAWTDKAFGGEYIRLMDVGVYPQDGNVAIVTDWYRTMKTTDGGKTWREIYSKEQPDGSFISRGVDVTNAYSVHFDPFDSSHIAVSYTDIGYHHSFNGGRSWIRSADGVPTEWHNTCYWVVFDPTVKNKVWSVWSSLHDLPRGKMTRNPEWKKHGKGGVCMSTDGGKTWKPVSGDMGFDSPTTTIVLDPSSPADSRTLYAGVYGKGIFKSTDDGKTWKTMNNGIGENKCAFELTLAADRSLFLVISPTPQLLNGKKGREYYSGAVYKSIDGAQSWKKLNVAPGDLFPSGIAVDPKNPKKIYLGCWGDLDLADLVGSDVARTNGENVTVTMPGGIFVSDDGGESWKQTMSKNQYVYDVTIDPWHPGRIYCNTFNQAAWRSDDDGKTWHKLKDYNFHWGQRVVIDELDHEKIYITTFGGSVYHGYPVTE